MLPILRPAFANLIRNYRSHPAILATPSSLFYNDTLEPEATNTESLLSWSGWMRSGWPVLFAKNEASDEIEGDGGGWYNVNESKMAIQYARSFLQSGLIDPTDICVMSPFQAQVRIIRKHAREAGMHGVNIGPLEAFQGLESGLVILCTTRTRNRFIDQDLAKGLGVIHERKRFNVALTRAKGGLIVIGNPDVLRQDENWNAFLAFCARNRLSDGPELEIKNEGSMKISRLEKQLLRREKNDHATDGVNSLSNGFRKLGFVEDAEQAMWSSGIDFEASLERNYNFDEAARQLLQHDSGH
jgi:helicase MOV-10